MVKSVTEKNPGESSDSTEANKYLQVVNKPGEERDSDSGKYKGVRKRKWGKWVSEIRLPNSRERIWLGSFDSAVKAARAFDAALYCLRGPTAKFNFPDNPPEIAGGRTLTPSQIRAAAARFANSEAGIGDLDHSTSYSSGSDELQRVDSPSRSDSVSDGATHLNSEMALDTSFLDQFETMGSSWGNNSVPDFGIFPGFDDLPNGFYMPPPPLVNYNEAEEACDEFGSFLWNF
uniref:AP2/ERF transcription factor n=1 Tax=Panax notoginseng TaxID=44586 RepID=A0A3Q8DCL2_9APIA|nr:AP2/ERF transcription factor [Panax notoginseng]